MPVTVVRNYPLTNQILNDLRAAAWEQISAFDWSPVLAQSLGWVCAVADDHLIGFVNVAWDGGTHAFLLDTTVHPDYQRQGIGRSLVREAALMAKERGAEWLHVDFEDDYASFYRGCGFRPTGAGLLHLPTLPPNSS